MNIWRNLLPNFNNQNPAQAGKSRTGQPKKESVTIPNNIYLPDESKENSWADKLIKQPKGAKPYNLIENAACVFRLSEIWKGRLRFNELSCQVELDGTPWDDNLTSITEAWSDRHLVSMGRSTIWNAARLVAGDQSYHPIRQYLESLSWDGVKRLETWLEVYARANDELRASPEYLSLVGRCFLISAVARVYQPGCQADNMLVLEGEQGLYKTTLFRTLFDPWFTDDIPSLTSKDARIALMGKWCILLDEMETWSKADHPIAKQFITRRVEDIRLPYDKFNSQYPRQCVFAGTLNPVDGFLSDPTGNRRYWSVTVAGKIDIASLTRDKHQLWAEALNCYKNGDAWWFKEETAKPYQEARVQEDLWKNRVESYIKLHAREDDLGREMISPSIDAIATAEEGLNIPLGKCGTAERKRICAILRRLGFFNVVRKVDKKAVRMWVKPLPRDNSFGEFLR